MKTKKKVPKPPYTNELAKVRILNFEMMISTVKHFFKPEKQFHVMLNYKYNDFITFCKV